jgi:hypothetical protein
MGEKRSESRARLRDPLPVRRVMADLLVEMERRRPEVKP